jgi:hypothetical protein
LFVFAIEQTYQKKKKKTNLLLAYLFFFFLLYTTTMRKNKTSWEDRAIEAVNSVSERKYDSDSVIRVHDDEYVGDGLIFPGENFDLFIQGAISGMEDEDYNDDDDDYDISGIREQVNKVGRFAVSYNSGFTFSTKQINEKLIKKGLEKVMRTYSYAEKIRPITDRVIKEFSQIKSKNRLNGFISFDFDPKEGLSAFIRIESKGSGEIEFIIDFRRSFINVSPDKYNRTMSLDNPQLELMYEAIADFSYSPLRLDDTVLY